MKTQFGYDAKNGDYVITIHQSGYQGKDVSILPGRVWNGKVYTGVIQWKGNKRTNIHKINAIMVIDPIILSQKQKDDIQADMAEHIPGFTAPPANLERYLERNYLDHINKVWDAFELCQDEFDIEMLIDKLKYGYGGKFGSFDYIADEEAHSFTIFNEYVEYDEMQEESREFDFYVPDNK